MGLDISLVLRSLDASRLGQGTVEVKELRIPRVYQAGLPVCCSSAVVGDCNGRNTSEEPEGILMPLEEGIHLLVKEAFGKEISARAWI